MSGPLLLNGSAGAVEGHEQRVSFHRNAVTVGPSIQEGDDRRLPVDERPVDVESDGIKIVEVLALHRPSPVNFN